MKGERLRVKRKTEAEIASMTVKFIVHNGKLHGPDSRSLVSHLTC